MAKQKHKKKQKSNQSKAILNKLNVLSAYIKDNVFIYQKNLTIFEFAKVLKKPSVEIIKFFFKKGIMKNQNVVLNDEEIGELCLHFNYDFKKEKKITAQNIVEQYHKKDLSTKNLKQRPPIVTIMGHVDHGKTTLLDKIRNSNVVKSEKGGITQHIGAYQIRTKKSQKVITFIDTPGHFAFSKMRARGSQVTDIIIIVISADEGIKPQTQEAIAHAKSAKVPIIFFINKIDLKTANVDFVINQLAKQNIISEEYGGEYTIIKGSAKTLLNIDELLENIILNAEVLNLQANFKEYAYGSVLEAHLSKVLGPSATLLIVSGTMHLKDYIIVGKSFGRIKLIFDHQNKKLNKGFPSQPVRIIGLNKVPKAGDHFLCFEDEKTFKKIVNERNEKEFKINKNLNPTIEDIGAKELKTINIIIKTDSFGVIEAIKKSLKGLNQEETKIKIIHSAVGEINESDVQLAIASNSLIYGFNIKCAPQILKIAKANDVFIKLTNIIYQIIDDLEIVLKNKRVIKKIEIEIGQAKILKIFNFSKIGKIAGCYVLKGKILKNQKAKIFRANKIIFEGDINSIKHLKDDVNEIGVKKECGITFKNFNDFQADDIIKCYQLKEVK